MERTAGTEKLEDLGFGLENESRIQCYLVTASDFLFCSNCLALLFQLQL